MQMYHCDEPGCTFQSTSADDLDEHVELEHR